MAGAVKVAVALGAMSPVLKAMLCGAIAVTVWVVGSSLWTVTVTPGFTVRLAGWKAKFLITIVAAGEADPPAGPAVR